jgi:hypothetical protein
MGAEVRGEKSFKLQTPSISPESFRCSNFKYQCRIKRHKQLFVSAMVFAFPRREIAFGGGGDRIFRREGRVSEVPNDSVNLSGGSREPTLPV